MSDEQKMPDVIYASDSSCDMMYGKWWRSKELDHCQAYLRCDIDPADAVVVSQKQIGDIVGIKDKVNLAAIQELKTTLHAAEQKNAALVEAVKNIDQVYICNDPGTLAEAIDRAATLAQQDQPAGEVLDADTLTIYFHGDITKPHSLTREDYDKLKASGMLWELYPDAPDHFIAATAR